MYLIVITWTYVTLMMAVAEATSAQGTVLGAIVTFALYGALPMSIVVYILRTPARKRAIREREAAAQAAYDAQRAAEAGHVPPPPPVAGTPDTAVPVASAAPNAGGKASTPSLGDVVTSVRKEP